MMNNNSAGTPTKDDSRANMKQIEIATSTGLGTSLSQAKASTSNMTSITGVSSGTWRGGGDLPHAR